MSKILKNKKQESEPAWLKKHHEDNQHHLGALKEHFTDGVKVIGEKVDFLEEKMDNRFDQVGKRFEQIDEKLNSHTEMIGKIMMDIEIMKSDIQIIKSDVKRKVDYEEFTKLERRVGLLESRAGRR